LIKNEDNEAKELSSIDFCSTCDPFSCSCNIENIQYENESIEFVFIGKSERNIMALEVEVKRITNKIRD